MKCLLFQKKKTNILTFDESYVKFEQYIGIKDSDDDEIYVGDILEIIYLEEQDYRSSTVEAKKIIVVDQSFHGEILCGYFDANSVISIKIIGNIHQNKDLMEV